MGNALSYHPNSQKLIQVKRDGVHLCWIDRSYVRPATGLDRRQSVKWETLVNGKTLRARSLTALKAKLGDLP
jgi:hypothetical protein